MTAPTRLPTDRALRVLVLGDSLSEGVGDVAPARTAVVAGTGWAGRLVTGLAARGQAVEFRSLARAGAHVVEFVHDQLPRARDAVAADGRADLVTCLGGYNDVLSATFDQDRYAAALDRLLATAREELVVAGGPVLTGTFHDLVRTLPLGPATRRRVRERIGHVNGTVREVAARHGVTVVDIGAQQHRIGLRSLSLDGLHPGPAGHADVADLAHRALAAAGYCAPPPAGPAARRVGVGRLTADLRHVGWLARRGFRTGAGREATVGDRPATGRTPPGRSRPSSP